MLSLGLATGRTLAQALHIFQRLASHLTMALLHMRGLLFWNGAKDGIPEVGEQ